MKYILEIRAAEGGDDSKLLVKDMMKVYQMLCVNMKWSCNILKTQADGSGFVSCSLDIQGKDLSKLKQESGGHRFQRVPPTERKGRVHTSTITVAIIDTGVKVDNSKYIKRSDKDFSVEWYSGTGKGGQHRNKHQNSCRLTHIPTGIVESRQGRERKSNLESAKSAIMKILDDCIYGMDQSAMNITRKSQIGSGMRGDKVRTIRYQDDKVIDHNSNKIASAKKYMKGDVNKIWQ
jgi:peptide chain release factor 1